MEKRKSVYFPEILVKDDEIVAMIESKDGTIFIATKRNVYSLIDNKLELIKVKT